MGKINLVRKELKLRGHTNTSKDLFNLLVLIDLLAEVQSHINIKSNDLLEVVLNAVLETASNVNQVKLSSSLKEKASQKISQF